MNPLFPYLDPQASLPSPEACSIPTPKDQHFQREIGKCSTRRPNRQPSFCLGVFRWQVLHSSSKRPADLPGTVSLTHMRFAIAQ